VLDVETITANGLCAGCGMCAGIGDRAKPAIVMQNSAEGYRRPVVVDCPPSAPMAQI